MRKFRFLIMSLLVFAALTSFALVGAQDEFATNTPAAELTAEAPVPAPLDDVPPVEQPSPFAGLGDHIFELVLLVAVVILAFNTKNLIPAELVDKVMEKGFGYAKEVTSKTATTLDDEAVAVTEDILRRIVKDELAKRGDNPTASIN